MKGTTVLYSVFVILLGILMGCPRMLTKPETDQLQRLSYDKAKTQILAGQTTQEQVRQAFGGPDLVAKDASGNPVWAYHNVSYESAQESSHAAGVFGGAGGPVAGVGVAGASSSYSVSGSRTATMLIYFDQHGIVQNFRMDVQKQ
jgi:outer membrane protein assembly factor BamE (lipoprotein component of BamABCDE complex)